MEIMGLEDSTREERAAVLGYEGTTKPARAGVWGALGWYLAGHVGTIVVFNTIAGYLWMLVRPAALIQILDHLAVVGVGFVGAFMLVRPRANRRGWVVGAVALGNGVAVIVLWRVILRSMPITMLYMQVFRFASRAHVPLMVVDRLVFLFYAFCVCLGVWGGYRAAVDRRER